MTFLTPAALWLALTAAAVVALYLLKIKRRRQTVPSLEFWRRLAGQTQVRSLFQRLKRWLSLALWLLIVACLVMALGNPVVSFGRIKPQSIAVILDNSASMQTLEPVEDSQPISRLELARVAVRELTSRRPVSDEWMLIEAGRAPIVRVPWTLDREAIRDAAAAIVPYHGTGDLNAASELASQLLAGKERPCIVVLSDGAAGAAAKLAEADESFVFWPIGSTDDNLGIACLRARTNRDRAEHHAFIRIVNASPQRVESQVVLELDGSAVGVEPFAVEPRGSWEKTVTLSAPQGAVLRASIDRPDALATDNEAFAVLDPIAMASVALVSPAEDAFFFEQALAAMESLVDSENSRSMTPAEYESIAPAAPFDLFIFNNAAPSRWPEGVPCVFINAWPADVPARVAGTIEHPELSIALRDHPLCRYLSASGATLARARQVDLPQRTTILAHTSDGSPLIFLIEQPNRTALCVAFDVMESDLPFRNAFPLLLRNAVTYLVSRRASIINDQYRIGDAVEPLQPLPTDIDRVVVGRLRDNGESQEELRVEHGGFVFEDTQEPGPLRFMLGDATVYAAVNLADADESNIAPIPAAQPPEQRLALTGRMLGTVPWIALAALATTLIGLEWMTYHFRWTE